MNTQSNFDKFCVSQGGRRLFLQYSKEEVGTWRIRGEDGNYDGESARRPELGIVQGKLIDVVQYAVDLPHFWQWGDGGEITKIEILKIDSEVVLRQKQLKEQKISLENQLKEVQAELAKLNIQT